MCAGLYGHPVYTILKRQLLQIRLWILKLENLVICHLWH